MKAEHENIHRIVPVGMAFRYDLFKQARVEKVDNLPDINGVSRKAVRGPSDDAVNISCLDQLNQ
jgi:hypothetical protein